MASVDTTELIREYAALTEHCGLLDRSERGKLALTGADAVEFLNGQVTNELLDLTPGHGCYAAFLTHKGKMLGDLRILAVGDDTVYDDHGDSATDAQKAAPTELLLDTERVALQGLFDMIRRFKVGYRVDLHKRTLEASLLSLIGPAAAMTAERAFSWPVELPEHENDHVLAGQVRLVATNFGFDLLCASDATASVLESLKGAGAEPVSEAAAEIVRVEGGRPRYGIDIDENTIPQEAGLNERAVSFTKGCYVGQETVARLHYRGKPNRRLRGLRLSDPTASGAELHLGERPVGALRSTVLSPTFGPIGLALLRREAEPGATLAVGDGGATATVVELPFQ
ncbi:MAG TPA: glycine cleavage T C-terminal barrel domain-containing protein [Solirubrobacteraceae bacterium]|nr:glycine cleavage T C-terminal barrel domain-containing protein [Solirubrobacteraceae bacterium]